jgi:hypothetical protein
MEKGTASPSASSDSGGDLVVSVILEISLLPILLGPRIGRMKADQASGVRFQYLSGCSGGLAIVEAMV